MTMKEVDLNNFATLRYNWGSTRQSKGLGVHRLERAEISKVRQNAESSVGVLSIGWNKREDVVDFGKGRCCLDGVCLITG